uniref:Uncharacterized protein n=1 Tax=Acrobeloides nanus TaxID=290746 RepID=A0A914DEN2_9BILA
MLYMMYAGVAPTVIGCGEHNFSHIINQQEICDHLIEVQQNESCSPKFDIQFKSVNYEWGYYCTETKKVKTSISAQMIGVMVGS